MGSLNPESKMKVLITGGKGQLAQAFKAFFQTQNVTFRALGREELDISNPFAVFEVIREYKPTVVINCAAYNLVDRAEEAFGEAYKVNSLGPYNLALASKENGCFLIHFSTDYVFDGRKGDLYEEEDLPRPINKYGWSKYLGEKGVRELLEDTLIFRVSWLFGPGRQNFLAKLCTWAQGQETLRLAYDEFSVPTYVKTVAEVAWKAYQKGLRGLYHLTSRGYCSRLEWAKFFLAQRGIKRKLIPVSAQSFGLPAVRPFFSALSPQKLEQDLGIVLPSWQEEVRRYTSTLSGELL